MEATTGSEAPNPFAAMLSSAQQGANTAGTATGVLLLLLLLLCVCVCVCTLNLLRRGQCLGPWSSRCTQA